MSTQESVESKDKPLGSLKDVVAARTTAGLHGVAKAAPAPEPNIRVSSMNFFYGPKQALYDINIDIPSRRVTAFIGQSGCGKSTFLRSLNRMNDIIPRTRVEGDVVID